MRLPRPCNPALAVSPFGDQQVVGAGDLAVNPFSIEQAIGDIEHGARHLLDRAPCLPTLGGDHAIALPLLRAFAARHGPLAMVHFDAHLDTWDAANCSACCVRWQAPTWSGPTSWKSPPSYDHAQITGIAAAHIGYEILSVLAARKTSSNAS